ncbi:MAG: hypothetical protein RR034_00150 [Bacteroidales bacterium]
MKTRKIIAIMLLLALSLSSCAPKIIGKRKHKKLRNCGCGWVTTQSNSDFLCQK